MRRWTLLAAAALVLLGCQVSLEGAKCDANNSFACPDGQACGFSGKCSKAAASCSTPICRVGSCSTSGQPTTCVADAIGACAVAQVGRHCETYESCEANGPSAACLCNADSDCLVDGDQCSQDLKHVVTCSTDFACRHRTLTKNCTATEICAPSAACVTRVVVAITEPLAGLLLGRQPVTVAAKVTRGSGAVGEPDHLELRDGVATPVVLARAGQGSTALETLYQGSYTPQNNIEANVTLVAVAVSEAPEVTSPGVQLAVDTKSPTVATPVVTCGASACVRDSVATVSVDVVDGSATTVRVAIDGGTPVEMDRPAAPSTTWVKSIPLRTVPVSALAKDLSFAVSAVDAAGNTAGKVSVSHVTRLRWSYSAPSAVTSPAFAPDGNLVVGLGGTTAQLRAIGAGGSEAWSSSLEAPAGAGKPVVHAPIAGTFTPVGGTQTLAVWAAADDGRLWLRKGGGASVAMDRCPVNIASALQVSAPASVDLLPTPPTGEVVEGAFAAVGGASPRLYGFTNTGCNVSTQTSAGPSVGVVASGPRAFTLTEASGIAAVTRYTFVPDFVFGGGTFTSDPSLALTDGAPTPVLCDRASSTPGIDSAGLLWVGCANGALYWISGDYPTAATKFARVAGLGARVSASPVLLAGAGGDVLVGTADAKVHRVSRAGAETWPPVLVSSEVTGLALLGDGTVVVSTLVGRIHIVDVASGTELWSSVAGVLGNGSLDFPNVVTWPGAGANDLPTLYLGSAPGNLHAIVVDAGLDAQSPWPKTRHDSRNTGNASSPLP